MVVDSLDHEYIFTLLCHFKVRKLSYCQCHSVAIANWAETA